MKALISIVFCVMLAARVAPAFPVPVDPRPEHAATVPLTFEEIVRFFEETLGQGAEIGDAGAILFSGGLPTENAYSITVKRLGDDVRVQFAVIDDYGMNWLREFLEAPCFSLSESERLFFLLHHTQRSRTLNLGRFIVTLEISASREQFEFTFTLHPLHV